MNQDPALHPEPEDQVMERRRDALLETLAIVEPDEVETRFRAFFGAGSGAWNGWDERFLDFIAEHRGTPLLGGKAGAEFFVVFSPAGRAGFWVFAQPGGGHGKGFLGARDVDKLLALAAQKGLAGADGR
ncbi:MAG: hypothetical protein MUE42_06795 [Opitutaceae bacterium]|jgi:hypothetical protein|nr:hypothetical protein [Opitutaceae bacterium]